MSEFDIQGAAVRDPRLAIHAASARPAWLWAADGSRLLWTNAAAAAIAGATADLATDEETHRQVAQLAAGLDPAGAPQLEKLHGFGTPPGELRSFACARIAFDGEAEGVLIAAIEPSGSPLAHVRRLAFLTDRLTQPAAAFSAGGGLLTWNAGAENFVDGKLTLASLGLEEARHKALDGGVSTTVIGDHAITLHRLGREGDYSLMALIAPAEAFIDEDFADEVLVDEDDAAPVRQTIAIAETAPHADVAPLIEDAADNDAFDESLADEILVDEDDGTPVRQATAIAETTPHTEVTTPIKDAADSDAFDESLADEILVDEDDATTPREDAEAARQPVRFSWVMNADGRFALGADEFSRLVGPQTSAAFGRPWRELTDALHLDPTGAFEKAVAGRAAFNGLTVHWPFDGGDTRLPVELSAEPMFDRAGRFAGYRGTGVCNDLPRLTELAGLRRADDAAPSLPAIAADPGATPDEPFIVHETPARDAAAPTAKPLDPEPDVVPSENVVPFRLAHDVRQEPKQDSRPELTIEDGPDLKAEPQAGTPPPGLSPGENHAFDEIARRLTARLDQAAHGLHRDLPDELPDDLRAPAEPVAASAPLDASHAPPIAAWQTPAVAPPHRASRQDVPILDRIPSGILIYRLDKLLYANTAFLKHAGFDTLHALSAAGGLDALFVEPMRSGADSQTESGTQLTVTGLGDAPKAEARLFSIAWDDEPAMALILSAASAPASVPAPQPEVATPAPSAAANRESELHAILDTATDGIVLFERSGEITSCNRSAEALFGYDSSELARQNLADLFAPESQRIVLDYFESVDGGGAPSVLDHGRDVLARVRGGVVPLAMTMGRAGSDNSRFFAVFRDLSQLRKNETDLFTAHRQAEQARTARADVISRIDHDIRAPLNAIIGFADVMIEERFGPLGNERYAAYLQDIRASGERVLAIVRDMLDLSRIESGKLDLTLSGHNLNAVVEQCVAALQPQANRERIIIRTSLAHALPLVLADARTLSQIMTNLVTGSIRLSNPGGQVIVSTALSDKGEAVLRIRDTGAAMSDDDIAAATDPYGTLSPDHAGANRAGVNLSLTKALAQANHAQLHIRGAQQTGTLMELIFSTAAANVR